MEIRKKIRKIFIEKKFRTINNNTQRTAKYEHGIGTYKWLFVVEKSTMNRNVTARTYNTSNTAQAKHKQALWIVNRLSNWGALTVSNIIYLSQCYASPNFSIIFTTVPFIPLPGVRVFSVFQFYTILSFKTELQRDCRFLNWNCNLFELFDCSIVLWSEWTCIMCGQWS